MVVTRAPARISFANGGDTEYYLKEVGWGCIVNATMSSLSLQCSLSEGKRNFRYIDDFAGTEENDIIKNLKLDGGKLDLAKATIDHIHPKFSKSIEIRSNIPKESGLGGSSTFNVALALALLKDQDKLTNPEELANLTFHIERNILGVAGGYQDQWAAAYGRGLNFMVFKDGKVEVHPIQITTSNLKRLEENSLLVFFSKRERSGSAVHEDQKKKIENDPKLFRKIMFEKRNNTVEMKDALENLDFKKFAECMNKDWELKQKLSSKIGTRDEIFTTAMKNGALGGKLCGAGSGGTYYFYCEDGKRDQVLESIKDMVVCQLPFRLQRFNEVGGWYKQ